MNDEIQIDAQIREAQAAGDLEFLMNVYRELGEKELQGGRIDEGCFFLVQAYVYGLESGSPKAVEIYNMLKGYGREE